MTSGTGSAGDRTRETRATVEWLPADLERLRVIRLVERSFEEAERILRTRPDELVRLAYREHSDGEGVVRLVVHPLAPWLRRKVRVETFTSTDVHRSVVSIRWTPVRGAALLPTMDADISLRPHGSESSEVVLEGRYRPPLGLLGLIVDRLVGRFVASSTAKSFVDLLAEEIEKS